VVKFRCSHCAQKIAVNDEGIGVLIQCPTCLLTLRVPAPANVGGQPYTYDVSPRASVPPVDLPPGENVVTQLARLMMDKLVQTLLIQRRHLLRSQESGTQQIADLDQRLARVHAKYQSRIKNLERTLSMRDEEIKLLREENRFLLQDGELSRPPPVTLQRGTSLSSAAPARNTPVLPHTAPVG
jgi:hypothetical protein